MENDMEYEDVEIDGIVSEEQQFIGLDEIQKQFMKDLEKLGSEDPVIGNLKDEFEGLLSSLKDAKNNEERLKKKCEYLKLQIQQNSSRVLKMAEGTEQDQNTILTLKNEVSKYLNLREVEATRERRTKEIIDGMKGELIEMAKMVDDFSSTNLVNKEKIQALQEEKDELIRDREDLMRSIRDLSARKEELETKIAHGEEKRLQDQENMHSLLEQAQINRNEANSGEMRKSMLYETLLNMQVELDEKKQKLKEKEFNIQREKQDGKDNLSELAKLKHKQEGFNKMKLQLLKQQSELEAKYNEQVLKNGKLQAENNTMQAELGKRYKEVSFLKWKQYTLGKGQSKLKVRMLDLTEEKASLERKIATSKSELEFFQAEIQKQTKRANAGKQAIDSLYAQSRVLSKNIVELETSVEGHKDVAKRREYESGVLKRAIKEQSLEAQETAKHIAQFEKQRQKLMEELSKAKSKYSEAIEELRTHEYSNAELQLDIKEFEKRIFEQRKLYEGVRKDRNNYSNQIIGKQEEIVDLKSKFAVVHQQIGKLKKIIKEKDLHLAQLQFETRKIKQENERSRKSVIKSSKLVEESQEILDKQKAQVQTLEKVLKESQMEKKSLKNSYNEILAHRNAISSRIAEKNQEAAVILEKMRSQQITLQNAMAACSEQEIEMKCYHRQIVSLKREVQDARLQARRANDISQEIKSLEGQLNEEKKKVAALTEEIQKPMQFHALRVMESMEPELFAASMKVNALQKKLIQKTELVDQKNLELKEKEKICSQLNDRAQKYPVPKIVRQLSQSKMHIANKNAQIKVMAAELFEYRSRVIQYKDEIERLSVELSELHKKHNSQSSKFIKKSKASKLSRLEEECSSNDI